MSKRSSKIDRNTAETKIKVFLDLDDDKWEKNKIDTGIGFMDHMLTLMATHGMFRLDVSCKGDTNVDYHHSVEDIGIVMGQAIREALGNMKGIKRYGDILLPMDEALIKCAVDLSGRSFLSFQVDFPTEKVGDFDTELFKEFFIALVRKSEITLHLIKEAGENSHHIAEGLFKAFGRVLSMGAMEDPRLKNKVPSTKGVLV
ncbi:MAG: imidazoleglycerol-phosphate dehydratase HisB [Firmicutes bacterium]|nr:imidazoleglycerol-phosphate dehydratase HisB [Bacillota bacterium]